MKNTKRCPKCQSSDIILVPGKREEGGWTLHQAADMAIRELLRKHHRPISLKDALRESLRRQPANDQPKATVHRLRRRV